MNGKKSVRSWMSKLHGMPASHELKDDDVRQLLFDLESAYNEVGGDCRDVACASQRAAVCWCCMPTSTCPVVAAQL